MEQNYYNDELYHYGTKGMKWGVRRYQNADGSLTPAGEKRYGGSEVGRAKLAYKSAKKDYNDAFNAYNNKRHQAFSLSKKKRQANNERFENAMNKADAMNKAKADLKNAKNTAKAEKIYSKQGERQGRADFYKNKADTEFKSYDDTAKAFDKTAARLDKEGKYLRAEASRKTAEAIRKTGEKRVEEYRKTAESLMERSNYYGQKASKFTSKKNVTVGKDRINAVLKSSRKEGYKYQELAFEIAQEWEKES